MRKLTSSQEMALIAFHSRLSGVSDPPTQWDHWIDASSIGMVYFDDGVSFTHPTTIATRVCRQLEKKGLLEKRWNSHGYRGGCYYYHITDEGAAMARVIAEAWEVQADRRWEVK